MVTGFPHLLNNWNSDKTPPKTAPSRASQVWWWNNEIPTTFVDTFTTQLTQTMNIVFLYVSIWHLNITFYFPLGCLVMVVMSIFRTLSLCSTRRFCFDTARSGGPQTLCFVLVVSLCYSNPLEFPQLCLTGQDVRSHGPPCQPRFRTSEAGRTFLGWMCLLSTKEIKAFLNISQPNLLHSQHFYLVIELGIEERY